MQNRQTENASPAPSERARALEERLAQFAADCLILLDAIPRGRAGASNFRDQLARSSTAIAANYAEACASESRRDFASKVSLALKEAMETRAWLRILLRGGFFGVSEIGPLSDEVNSIVRILGKSVSTARERIGKEKPRRNA